MQLFVLDRKGAAFQYFESKAGRVKVAGLDTQLPLTFLT